MPDRWFDDFREGLLEDPSRRGRIVLRWTHSRKGSRVQFAQGINFRELPLQNLGGIAWLVSLRLRGGRRWRDVGEPLGRWPPSGYGNFIVP